MWGRITEGVRRLAIVLAIAVAGILLLNAIEASGWIPRTVQWLGATFALVWIILAFVAYDYVSAGFLGVPRRPRRRRFRATALRTKRLVLRRATEADIEPMHAILSDPESTRYWHALPHETIEQTRDYMMSLIDKDPATTDDFLVVRSGRVIGMMGAIRLPWIGFILAPDCWRQGYAREALDAFVTYMFERGWTGVVAATDECNVAARALLEGAGFIETGRSSDSWHVRGEPSNAVHYRLANPYIEASAGEAQASPTPPPETAAETASQATKI